MFKRLVILAAAIVIAVVSTFWLLAIDSQSGSALGLANEKLAPCPSSPNCVCSEFPSDEAHFIEPINYTVPTSRVMKIASEIISNQGGEIDLITADYLAATFSSDLFRFIDDMELRLDATQKQLHIRSAARVGHSDLGVNRDRAQRMSKLLVPSLNP